MAVRMILRIATTVLFGFALCTPSIAEDPASPTKPVLHWSFNRDDFSSDPEQAETSLPAAMVFGQPTRMNDGPAAPKFPIFASTNDAATFDGRSWITFDDPGDASLFDFSSNDAIAIEAWVRIAAIDEGQQVYVIGKGRTGNPNTTKENQSWALRLRGISGTARPSFLFRSADRTKEAAKPDDKPELIPGELHRWNADLGIEPDDQWHHVAVSFRFGSKSAPIAWVDGQPTEGSWDLGGKTFSNPPIADNDQIWIGSSMGGNPGASFRGSMDEVSVFRRELTDAEIQSRFRTTRKSTSLPEIADADVPAGAVLMEVRENVRLSDPWNRDRTRITTRWTQPAAAITGLPRKYMDGGLIADRTNPSVLRMRVSMNVPEVTTQFLIRSRSSARLLIDGKEVASLKQAPYASDGHQEVPTPPEPLYPEMHPVPAGDQESVVSVTLAAGSHLIEFETLVGGKNMRVEASETLVAMGSPERGFEVISPTDASYSLNESAWHQFREQHSAFLARLDQNERAAKSAAVADYWNRRHEMSRQLAGVSANPKDVLTSEAVDRLIEEELSRQQVTPVALVDDMTFLRRLSLNTVGVIPSRTEIDWFLEQPEASRRAAAVDRFLGDARWADHWVSYWQDVLAENPGILKPELNNTGPFRWWIYESFLDNKPMDRFATELVMMKGSKLGGGPAGFSMASQNDVPMAERALVLSNAFSARDMKCARCHDSPVNDVSQKQLFEMAAMLNRSAIAIPKTSSVPKGPNGERSKLITVSIEPGTSVAPEWPFQSARTHDAASWSALLNRQDDPREHVALHLTHPTESRFAEVIVNRLWARLFGRGLMPDADDWYESTTPHQTLLQALASQHIASGYDLKSTARLILLTNAWQRQTAPDDAPVTKAFGAQSLRRMTAEQMLDSLYAAVGKSFDAEMLTLDPEGRRPDDTFLNLGVPRRAWQFCSLSNERDRPALALPMAQSLVDLLGVFGWRDSRPHGVSIRDEQATVLQPLTLSNGNAGHRLVQLSDNATTTELALETSDSTELVRSLFLQILTRQPSDNELSLFTSELEPGFEARVVAGAQKNPIAIRRNAVSWSNHLNAEATRIKQELEKAAVDGDPPTQRLTESWRTQAEDVLWVLLNSPEFAFVP